MPQISVITVVFNNAAGMQRTMCSVLNQSYQDFEYIIVDGGSSDGMEELLKACGDPRVKWISEPDNGIYDAWRKALTMATAEYVTFIDSGNWYIRENTLAAMFAELQSNVEFLSFPYIHERLHGKHPQWKIAYPDPDLEHLYFAFDMFLHGSLIKRELFVKYGLPDPKYKCSGDHALVLSFYKNGVALDTGKTVNIYFLDGGVSSDPRKYAFQEDREIAIEFGKSRGLAWAVYWKRMLLFDCLVLLRKIRLDSIASKLAGKSPDISFEQLKAEYDDPYYPWFERCGTQ